MNLNFVWLIAPEIVIYWSGVVFASELAKSWMKTLDENELSSWGPPILSNQRSPLLQTCLIGTFWKLEVLWICDFAVILFCYVILTGTDLTLELTATWCIRSMGRGSGTLSYDLSSFQAVSSRILKGLPTQLKLPEFQEMYQI
jgi:hypothetical protein